MKKSEKKRNPAKKTKGRPISFDKDDLIDSVMHLFWERGYHNLSLNEIAHEVGLTRASLYNSFKNKDTLFMEAFIHYVEQAPDAILDRIKKGDKVGPAFFTMFDNASKIRAADNKRRGCLAVNSINEMISNNTPLGNRLKTMYDARRQLLENLMIQAIDQGELPRDTDPEVIANMMLAFISGFNVFAKSGASRKDLCLMSESFLERTGFSRA